MGKPVDWLEWREIDPGDLFCGPHLDLLTGLWIWGWSVQAAPTDSRQSSRQIAAVTPAGLAAVYVSNEELPYSACLPAYSSEVLWGWRTLMLAAERFHLDVSLERQATDAMTLRTEALDRLPVLVRLSSESRSYTAGDALPEAACRAAIAAARDHSLNKP